jgi:hypothetical protein
MRTVAGSSFFLKMGRQDIPYLHKDGALQLAHLFRLTILQLSILESQAWSLSLLRILIKGTLLLVAMLVQGLVLLEITVSVNINTARNTEIEAHKGMQMLMRLQRVLCLCKTGGLIMIVLLWRMLWHRKIKEEHPGTPVRHWKTKEDHPGIWVRPCQINEMKEEHPGTLKR